MKIKLNIYFKVYMKSRWVKNTTNIILFNNLDSDIFHNSKNTVNIERIMKISKWDIIRNDYYAEQKMKLTFYMYEGFKSEILRQNEACHHFYLGSVLSSDYVYNKNKSVNILRLRKAIDYDMIFASNYR